MVRKNESELHCNSLYSFGCRCQINKGKEKVMQKIDLKVAHLEEREKSNTNSTNYCSSSRSYWNIFVRTKSNK